MCGVCDVCRVQRVRVCLEVGVLVRTHHEQFMQHPTPPPTHLPSPPQVDLLPEINLVPTMFPPPEQLLPQAMRADVDTFIATRQPPTIPSTLKQRFMKEGDTTGAVSRYNVTLINAFVCYVGAQASAQGAKVGTAAMLQGPLMELFQRLTSELDAEGRYHLLNAIANQLRYPNAQTHYFSCVLLCLFADAQQELVQEQITRVLLERLIVNRPHPWGLLITFIELIKNPRYNFWKFQFTRCAPEIERLFESVARSCMAPQPGKEGEELGAGQQQQQNEALRA